MGDWRKLTCNFEKAIDVGGCGGGCGGGGWLEVCVTERRHPIFFIYSRSYLSVGA